MPICNLGQDARAKAVIDDMMTVPVSGETFLAAAYALAASPARYAVERGDWKAAAALEVRPVQQYVLSQASGNCRCPWSSR